MITATTRLLTASVLCDWRLVCSRCRLGPRTEPGSYARSGLTASSERSFFIPFSALTRATYVTSTASAGGNLVATDLLADDFIEALRNASPVMGLGVRTMTGLVGDVAIPRRSGCCQRLLLEHETTAITQSESTFDQVTMSPKNLASLSKYSRQTLIQGTPGIESLVRTDLTDGILAALDSAVINGSGSSGQPTGIRNTGHRLRRHGHQRCCIDDGKGR